MNDRLGDWDVNTDMEPYAHMEFAVDSIFVHEWFFSARSIFLANACSGVKV